MKQFTNREQTKKLKGLGFPLPQAISDHEYDVEMGRTTIMKNYSIGELLNFLDSAITESSDELIVWKDTVFWYVKLSKGEECSSVELVDALYEYCVILKEGEII